MRKLYIISECSYFFYDAKVITFFKTQNSLVKKIYVYMSTTYFQFTFILRRSVADEPVEPVCCIISELLREVSTGTESIT